MYFVPLLPQPVMSTRLCIPSLPHRLLVSFIGKYDQA